MSDDDQFMMSDDGENYDFEFESDADSNVDSTGESKDLENLYYAAKSQKEESSIKAISAFEKLAFTNDSEQSEWGFKALKQMTKIYFKEVKEYKKAFETYKALLSYSKHESITKNYIDKTING